MDTLSWEASYAIAQALLGQFPQQKLDEVSLEMIYAWTLALPNFDDDPEMVTQDILAAIYQEWYELTLDLESRLP